MNHNPKIKQSVLSGFPPRGSRNPAKSDISSATNGTYNTTQRRPTSSQGTTERRAQGQDPSERISELSYPAADHGARIQGLSRKSTAAIIASESMGRQSLSDSTQIKQEHQGHSSSAINGDWNGTFKQDHAISASAAPRSKTPAPQGGPQGPQGIQIRHSSSRGGAPIPSRLSGRDEVIHQEGARPYPPNGRRDFDEHLGRGATLEKPSGIDVKRERIASQIPGSYTSTHEIRQTPNYTVQSVTMESLAKPIQGDLKTAAHVSKASFVDQSASANVRSHASSHGVPSVQALSYPVSARGEPQLRDQRPQKYGHPTVLDDDFAHKFTVPAGLLPAGYAPPWHNDALGPHGSQTSIRDTTADHPELMEASEAANELHPQQAAYEDEQVYEDFIPEADMHMEHYDNYHTQGTYLADPFDPNQTSGYQDFAQPTNERAHVASKRNAPKPFSRAHGFKDPADLVELVKMLDIKQNSQHHAAKLSDEINWDAPAEFMTTQAKLNEGLKAFFDEQQKRLDQLLAVKDAVLRQKHIRTGSYAAVLNDLRSHTAGLRNTTKHYVSVGAAKKRKMVG